MVVLDRATCVYCGGCVSVCPVGALSLAETCVIIDERCIDCGDCVSACPVGALQPAEVADSQTGRPSRRQYDLVVVGAGPGGSVAAHTAAEAGLSVLLLEKRQEIGSPVRCAEGVGQLQLSAFVEPDPRWIAAQVSRAEITTVVDGVARTHSVDGGQGYILERRLFDRFLAERAARAGAEVRVKTAVTGLLKEDGRVCGVTIDQGGFFSASGPVEVEARLVIAADGVEAQVGSWAGLQVHLPLKDTMVCVQYLLAGIDIDPTCTYYVIDNQIAPGGYAWIFPKGDHKANVGLGVQADLWQEMARRSRIAGEGILGFLTRFIESHPALAQGYPVTLVGGVVPVALSPERIVTHGLVLVGDAARQVDPLTGGGILNAMTAGQLAAQTGLQAIEAGDLSAPFLARYEEAWHQSQGRRLQRNYRLRAKFAPEERTQERFVQAFLLAAAG
jgi:digeranylgeranylglycerophospholipid reductase